MKTITLDRTVGYTIEVQGHLDPQWGESLGVAIATARDDPPVSSLTARLDQAGLHGLLRQLYAIGLPLISVHCTDATTPGADGYGRAVRRRSVRSYQPEAPTTDVLLELIREATYAPSSGNEQPWKFIIVRDRSLLERVSDDAKSSLLADFRANPENSARKYEPMLSNPAFNIFYNAPTAVFIVAEASRRNVEINCALAACYFMIAAANRGLGTCWIQFARFVTDSGLLQELGVPDGNAIIAPIIVGTPTNVPNAPRRREPEIVRIISE